jgi:hypothetical protein
MTWFSRAIALTIDLVCILIMIATGVILTLMYWL